MKLWQLFFLFLGFQSLFLGLLFFFKKSQSFAFANRLFAMFLFLSGWLMVYYPLFWSDYLVDDSYVHFSKTYVVPLFLLGPTFFFYMRHIATGQLVVLKSDFYHLLPAIGISISFLPYYRLPSQQKVILFEEGTWTDLVLARENWELLALVLMGFYLYIIFTKYLKHFEKERDLRIWLKAISLSFAGCVLSLAIYYLLFFTNLLTPQQDFFVSLLMAVSVFVTAYFAFNYPHIFNGKAIEELNPMVKYKKTGLSPDFSDQLKTRLLAYMEQEKPHLDRELRLDVLATALGVGRHHTSQVINEHFGTNFFDFVNSYRVAEAARLIEEGKQVINLSEIAFIAGFNNTVSFNKAFKKNKGITPSQYRKNLAGSIMD